MKLKEKKAMLWKKRKNKKGMFNTSRIESGFALIFLPEIQIQFCLARASDKWFSVKTVKLCILLVLLFTLQPTALETSTLTITPLMWFSEWLSADHKLNIIVWLHTPISI